MTMLLWMRSEVPARLTRAKCCLVSWSQSPSVGREWAGRGAGAWHLHLSDQHINHTHFPTSYVAAEAASVPGLPYYYQKANKRRPWHDGSAAVTPQKIYR